MRVVGLVTEYNPFHNGHLYHLSKAVKLSEADYSVAVMSGHFLQRGEPALLDKWTRAGMAVASGVDLVIELPYVFSCRSAYAFARGAVSILHATGLVTHLCFGSEEGDLNPLQALARLFNSEPPQFQELVKKHLKTGLTLPLAQTKALNDYIDLTQRSELRADILNNPNNILGIEYLRSLLELGSNIEPFTIQRMAAGYHDTRCTGPFASATSIRELLSGLNDLKTLPTEKQRQLKEVLPTAAYEILKDTISRGEGPVFGNNFFPLLLYRLRMCSKEELSLVMDINEGLENRILNQAGNSFSLKDLVENIKTKRYTWTRIQRVLNYILLHFTRDNARLFDEAGPQYIRLLAYSAKGRRLVAAMRKTAALPVVTRVAPFYKKAHGTTKRMLDYDLKATDLYTLGYNDPLRFIANRDFITGPILAD